MKQVKRLIVIPLLLALFFGLAMPELWMTASAETNYRPDSPTVLKSALTYEGTKVVWQPVESASGYCLYRKINHRDWEKVKTIHSGATTAVVDTKSGVREGDRVQYRMKAYRTVDGKNYFSAYSPVYTTWRVNKLTMSCPTYQEDGVFTINWKQHSRISGYQIQYSDTKGFPTCETVTIRDLSQTSLVIEGFAPGQNCYIRMRSFKQVNGETFFSPWYTTLIRTPTKTSIA